MRQRVGRDRRTIGTQINGRPKKGPDAKRWVDVRMLYGVCVGSRLYLGGWVPSNAMNGENVKKRNVSSVRVYIARRGENVQCQGNAATG